MNHHHPVPLCRLCGSGEVKYLGAKPGRTVAVDFHYFECQHCRFIFVDPTMGEEIYNEAYYLGQGADPYVDYSSEYMNYAATDRLAEFEDLFSIAREALRGRPVHSRAIEWLDFGCGAGGFLKFLRETGSIEWEGRRVRLNITGHDVGSWASRLQSEDGFNIINLEQLQRMESGTFDVISLVEVIEHISFPAEVIKLASRLLKPGGVLLLTTGNMHSLVARRAGIHYRYCIGEIHVSLFSPAALNYIYTAAGLQPFTVRFRGVVVFKVLKSILNPFKKRVARFLLHVPFFVRAIDQAYGVSQMPCARKPLDGGGAVLAEALSARADSQ